MKNLINKFQNFFNPKHPLHLGFWNKNCSIVQMKKWCGDHGIDWKKEIIISFFKPFLCDKDFEKALGKQYPSRVSKLGIIQDRMSNVFKQTNLIYHFFDKQIMEEFLNSLDISYNFQTVYGKQILFIKK